MGSNGSGLMSQAFRLAEASLWQGVPHHLDGETEAGEAAVARRDTFEVRGTRLIHKWLWLQKGYVKRPIGERNKSVSL